MSRYAKTVVAVIGATCTIISTAAVPERWRTLASAVLTLLTAAGVYQVPNRPAPTEDAGEVSEDV